MDLLLGIDVGTTGTKCMVVDIEGKILTSSYKSYKLYNDKPGWVEQNASEWWDAVVYTTRQCTLDSDIRNSIKAVSISSQGGSIVPVDEKGIPLRRAISWMDKRGEKQRLELSSNKEKDYYYNTTGSRLSDGGNLIQIKWLRDNEPDIFNNTYKFLSTIDYINYKLTGNYVIDVTNAAMTQLLNIRNKTWDNSILMSLHIDEQKLPVIVKSGEVIGVLGQYAAEQMGLPGDVTVVNGGHDQYCVALGSGALNDGDLVLSTGTAWVVLYISDNLLLDPENNFYAGSHVLEGKWGLLADLPTGGVCLEWLRNNLFSFTNMKDEIFAEDLASIDKMASERSAGCDGLMFFPHFTGVGCPNWAPKNKGTYIGLDLSHDKYHLARAIMEGVGYEIRWMLEAIENNGVHISSIKMHGGASRSSLWPGIIADITGMTIRLSEAEDMACIGAAILAGKGAGLFKTEEEGYRKLIKKEKEILPNTNNIPKYSRLFDEYKQRFILLKKLYSN